MHQSNLFEIKTLLALGESCIKNNLKGEKVTRQKKIKQNQCAFLGPIFNKFSPNCRAGELGSLFTILGPKIRPKNGFFCLSRS